MKTTYIPVWGSQQKWDLALVKPVLSCTKREEVEALESGWLHYNGEWYLSRSTRINLKLYEPRTWPKCLSWSVEDGDFDRRVINKILKQFLEYRGFEDLFDPFDEPENTRFLIVRDEDEPVAFTKFMVYEGGLESQMTAWNYHKPKLSVGRLIIDKEVEYARELGLKHLYIGPGYEKSSVYKSNIPGFEWWNGSQWSTDSREYTKLCERDEKVRNFDDLQIVWNNKCKES